MSELRIKIAKWLEEQGYPLEMRVARAFRSSGFRVIQSDFYQDPKTGNQREIDVIASFGVEFEGFLFRVQFVVECIKGSSRGQA